MVYETVVETLIITKENLQIDGSRDEDIAAQKFFNS